MYSAKRKEVNFEELLKNFSAENGGNGKDLRISAHLTSDFVFVSGPKDDLLQFKAYCKTKRVASHVVNDAYGFHHPILEGAAQEFRKAVEAVHFGDPEVPVLSNFTGNKIDKNEAKDVLVRQIYNPILLLECIQNALRADCNVFIDVG
jgi:malonyl CoA-acyl carrier protein transacylase